MDAQQDLPRITKIRFRVLIIGRAGAGKTSILLKVCDITDWESPEVYRLDPSGTRHQVDPIMDLGGGSIDDELVFPSHDGYVFHDSRGFESGSENDLKAVQDFVRRKSQERQLQDRLHAIWYCIPMDHDRPSLDLKHFKDICPDKNVPVIAVFTKFDQFRRNIRMQLEDEGRDKALDWGSEVESIFERHYVANLWENVPFVRLEGMYKSDQRATNLIETTANVLSGGVAVLMLMAVQRNSLEISIKQAIKWSYCEFGQGIGSTEAVIKTCIMAFPSLWYPRREEKLKREEELLMLLEKLEKLRKLFVPKLILFFGNPSLCISSDDTHHVMIGTILILNSVSYFFASSEHPTLSEALDKACSRYVSSDAHSAVKGQFSLSPKQYSMQQFTEFILSYHL